MKERNKAALGLLCVLLCIFFVSVTANANTNGNEKMTAGSVIQKYAEYDEQALNEALKKLGTEELMDDIKALLREDFGTALIPFISELSERKDAIGEGDIISEIKDSSNSIMTQELMVDLLIWKNQDSLISDTLKQLLSDPGIDNQVKARIVSQSAFGSEDVPLLKDLIKDNDDILAFDCLKKLSNVEEKEAYTIAKEILSTPDTQSDMKISAAQKSTAKFLKNDNDPATRKEFIEQCMDIIEDPKSGEKLKDSSMFALSDMMTKESITEIVNSDSLEQSFKVFCIDQNHEVLKEMLINSPEEKDIQVVVKAMEILPLIDLEDQLQKVQREIKDPELKAKCEKALENIKLNGTEACKKWNED